MLHVTVESSGRETLGWRRAAIVSPSIHFDKGRDAGTDNACDSRYYIKFKIGGEGYSP